MKKTLWMLGVAVAALTSCTQSEVLDVPESKMIGFDSFVGKETRADVTNGNFKKFFAYCAKGTKTDGTFTEDNGGHYMSSVEVTRTQDAQGKFSTWSYTDPKEWVIHKYYRFAAYADGENTSSALTFNPNISYTENNNPAESWGFNINDYTVGTNDLVVAVSEERETMQSNTGHKSVNFSFAHLLAKVEFRFSYITKDDAANTTVQLYPFSFEAIKTSDGKAIFYDDLSFTNNTRTYVDWASQFETCTESSTEYSSGTYTFFPVNSPDTYTEINSENPVAQYECYVIPQSNNFEIDNIHVKIMKGDVVSSEYTYNDVSLLIADHEVWKPGYTYRYEANLNASTQYIEFTGSVRSWIDDADRDAVIGGTTTEGSGESGSGGE